MSESSLRVALTGFLQLSHAFRRAAAGRLARFTPARGQSITTPSQHVRPALCADRPRFAAGDTLPTRRDSRGTSPMQAPSAPSLLRKTAPFLCPRQRSQFCPCVAARRSVLPPQNRSLSPPPTVVTVLPLRRPRLCLRRHAAFFPRGNPRRRALARPLRGLFLYAGFAKRRVSCRVPRRRRQC